ncbi:MAG TPA: hypothetical protein VK543_13145 [Puia sp.]|nr:hypothetical protein [Puia sp.]
MKHSHLLSCAVSFFIMTIAFSCKKDSMEPTVPPACNPCNTIKPATFTVHIIDSSWEKQSSGNFTSNFSELLKTVSISEAQIYSIIIVRETNEQRIFLNGAMNYAGGALGLNDHNHFYQFTYSMEIPSYFGETPQNVPLPFKSIDVKLAVTK